MFIMHYIKGLFPKLPPTASQRKARLKENNRKLVALFAKGNIALQRGDFITDEDMKLLRKKIAHYNFG